MKKLLKKTNEKTSSRPPIVVVLGHVDHGKTTLLDAIRKTDVATGEHGGITQSIGAYQIKTPSTITFIDTPGHEAFSKMRTRGASIADIAILVVAANDSVMPQTVESIKIIKETKIPFIVVINKIDLPEANFDKVVKDLLRHEVMLETYGGDVPFIKVSAKKGEGIDKLLDLICLLADMSGVYGNDNGNLEAYVIESRLDKTKGALATAIVKNGVLKIADEIYIDGRQSKIRALTDYNNEQIKEAHPGDPVEILGLTEVPQVGSLISHLQDQVLQSLSIPSVLNRSDQAGGQSLCLILKTDSVGTLEAIVAKIPPNVNLISSSVGEISEADILLARSTKAIVLGFNVKISSQAQKLAEVEKVLARTYKIIYELLDELSDAASGMLEPIVTEEILGKGQIVAEFPFEKSKIVGTRVTEGRIARGDLVKIGELKSKIKSVRVGKDEINKIDAGKECGILLDPQIDFKIGDDIISYRLI